MPTTKSFSNGPFKLGLPTIPGHRNGTNIDDFAQRAITSVGDALGATRWLEPEPAVRVLGLGDEDDWRDRHILVLLDEPFEPVIADDDGMELGVLLRKLGHTALLRKVRAQFASLGPSMNAKAIAENSDIFNFMFTRAYYALELTDAEGIAGWMADDHEGGTAEAYQIIAEEAMVDYANVNKIEVDVAGGRDQFRLDVQAEVLSKSTPFEKGVFEDYLRHFVEDFAYRRVPLQLIKQTANDDLSLDATAEEIAQIARYFEKSPATLTPQNAADLIPAVLTQLRGPSMSSIVAGTTLAGPLDFDVRYHTETHNSASINTDNVLCAAQLFYAMTLGDELGVFRAADLLVTRYMGVGRVDVKSQQLLSDLQDYAFNDEFREVGTGRVHQRTSPEERRMFYRQVFDLGDTELLEGMVTNTDFATLWSSLMVETVRYIEKVEQSEQPESFVSRNAVAQVIEDLQYNLSTFASGMAKVMTPIVYRELDFLIEKVWKSQEIIDQVALHNTGSYWRAIERVLQEDEGHSVSLTALQKKAQYGHQILQAIAEYTPQMVANDGKWANLVSTIEAFIITSDQVDPVAGRYGSEPVEEPPIGLNGSTAPVDEWAF